MSSLETLRESQIFADIDWQILGFLSRLHPHMPYEISLAILSLSLYTREQHACVPLQSLAGQQIHPEYAFCFPAWEPWFLLLSSSPLIGPPESYNPLILDEYGALYFFRSWQYELRLSRAIKALCQTRYELPAQETARALNHFFGVQTQPNWQQLAALFALQQRLTIISGGPGTGKTTTVFKILLLLREQGLKKMLLAAPTGKAAMRMSESIKAQKRNPNMPQDILDDIPEESLTLHRLLGYTGGTEKFKHHANNPLNLDVLIVDEASMIDLALMTRLLEALPPEGRLILLGDKDQLASVEAGSVLGDLCGTVETGAIPETFKNQWQTHFPEIQSLPTAENPLQAHIIQLQHSYRFEGKSGIGQLALKINQGDVAAVKDVLTAEAAFSDIQFSPLPGKAEQQLWHDNVLTPLSPYLQSTTPEEALNHLGQFRILAALKHGPQGVNHINHAVETLLARAGLLKQTRGFYHLKPIMIRSNDYYLQLFNGDMGVCWQTEKGLQIWFQRPDNQFLQLHPNRVPEHVTAWAMTIHKSQGSEFNTVLMILPDKSSPILTRELIYTGITRAKEKVLIWGEINLMLEAIQHRVERASGLSRYFLL